MKKFLLGTVSAVALAQAASAADLAVKAAPPPIPTWAGWYFGIDGGVTRHDASFNDLSGIVRSGDSTGTKASSQTGGVVGVNAGVNWQDGSFVYGLEADWNWIGAKAETTWGFNTRFATGLNTSFDVPWIATVRGRIGLAVGATLPYFTGGLAFGQVRNSATHIASAAGNFGLPPGALLDTFSQNTTKVGWTAGVGVEHMFSRNWTVRAEVRYVDLGRSSVSCVPAAPTTDCANPNLSYRGEFSNSLIMALVGVDFKF
jgi:outer membrane immunogenic protein